MADGLVAWVFPGQGSQEPGMGRDLYESYEDINQRIATSIAVVPTARRAP